MKAILLACVLLLAGLTGTAAAGGSDGDVIGYPDNGYRITQRHGFVRVFIKYAYTHFPIEYRFDRKVVEPTYGRVTFTDPEGNQDYVCQAARFNVANTGRWLRIVEFWDGEWMSTGNYRVRR